MLAGTAAWLAWSLTRPPQHVLAPEDPPLAVAPPPIELPPVEVVADPPAKPRPPRALEASLVPSGPLSVPPVRVAGEERIPLPRTTLLALARQGIEEEDVSVSLCLDSRGVPVSSRVVTSSGLADLEAYVSRHVMRWRYLPLLVGGDPKPTCTRLRLRYLVQF
jgi:hypothetical protein